MITLLWIIFVFSILWMLLVWFEHLIIRYVDNLLNCWLKTYLNSNVLYFCLIDFAKSSLSKLQNNPIIELFEPFFAILSWKWLNVEMFHILRFHYSIEMGQHRSKKHANQFAKNKIECHLDRKRKQYSSMHNGLMCEQHAVPYVTKLVCQLLLLSSRLLLPMKPSLHRG